MDLNANLITLIPKKDSPELISQFCPIALCNVLMKVMKKVVANRLRPIMPKLTGDMQSNFVPRINAVDNIFLALEVIHAIRKEKGRQGFMAVKIHLEKAYGRIEWDLLDKAMHQVGFEQANRGFIWRDSPWTAKFHNISKTKVCQPKERGGLGLRHMKEVNHTSLARSTRRFFGTKNSFGFMFFVPNMGIYESII